MGMNFRIFWDGDPYEELLDGNRITKFSAAEGYKDFKIGNTIVGDLGHSTSCNGTKATPCLSADIFGDWRGGHMVGLQRLYNAEHLLINGKDRLPCADAHARQGVPSRRSP